MQFQGRTRELKLLRDAAREDRGRLVVVYGRRRVGKTTLIEEAFKDQPFWKFEGLENTPVNPQLRLFARLLADYVGGKPESLADWQDALAALARALEARPAGVPVVVFLDEFQWLCNLNPGFVSIFKFFWDNHFSRLPRCLFVICGSVSSFLVKQVVHSKALYGRVDLEIHLGPLALNECAAFLAGRSKLEILETHMVLGGIPQYLLELEAGQSLPQNLERLAFSSGGYFVTEYNRLFISHFAASPVYERVVAALADGPRTAAELARSARAALGGAFYDLLRELELAGFIESFRPVFKPDAKRLVRYRIADEYLHFYYHFVQRHAAEIAAHTLQPFQVFNSGAYRQWRGLAFERLCRRHAARLAAALGFSGIRYSCGSWFERGQADQAGAQIDLAFLRADQVVTICEMKFADRLTPAGLAAAFEARKSAVAARLPDHAVQCVLVLAKTPANLDALQSAADAVLPAQDILF